jgi:UDP-2,4-diacetamido-2,4,6-trideoxy-beta-L-altropyranose hydrolase
MNRDLIIRTDGSAEIGLGHVVRCISLGIILKDVFDITFVYKKIPKGLLDTIKKTGFKNLEITKEESFFDLLTPVTTVVLDGYSFGPEYQKKIKRRGSILVCIDDVYETEFYADLIINQAPGITKHQYQAQKYTKFALGVDYTLLRPPFLEAVKNKKLSQNNDTILVCFGGSDNENLTHRTVNILSGFDQFKKITIITGSAYLHEKELKEKIRLDKRVEYFHALDQQKMAALMNEADVAIVPASGILFEVLATGTTAISGMYTDNQKNVYSGFKKMNAFIDAGTFQVQQIEKAIKNLGDFKNPTIIDGKSPERLLKLFQSLKISG